MRNTRLKSGSTRRTAAPDGRSGGLYLAIWRWHFFAGLFTLPFLALLAVTGSLYLFKDEINDWRYRDLLLVAHTDGANLDPSVIVAAAVQAKGGRPTAYSPPAAPGRSARVTVQCADDSSRNVYVDPGSGQVLGELAAGEFGNLPLMDFVRRLHSLAIIGWPGNRLIEIVAGWAIILAGTGVYLWWPRGRQGGVLTIRRKSGKRTFWRDLHAVTGVCAAALIVFMALTGLPWSGVWGEGVKALMHRTGLGYPDGFWFPVAKSALPAPKLQAPVPWSFEKLPVPSSLARIGQALDIDAAVLLFGEAGMAPGYTVTFPQGPEGVWSASVMPSKVDGIRRLHFDQYTGEVLLDMRYADLGAPARAIEWGISVHTGQEFGRTNQVLMLLVCFALLAMSVSAVHMWLRRRPSGSLGAPRVPDGHGAARGVCELVG